MNDKKLVSVEELSEILKVPRSWIYQRTRLGQDAIPHIKVGKYVRFNPDEVIMFLRNPDQQMTERDQ